MTWRIVLSGLPGSMARETLAELRRGEDAARVLDVALTSERHDGERAEVNGAGVRLVGGTARDALKFDGQVIAIDFSTPDAALPNARWFCERGIPFVTGTTGGDMEAIAAAVRDSAVSAVVAPNMAAPIVLMQHAVAYLAREFPGALAGHALSIRESHQATKRDTSGTAKAMLKCLNTLGLEGELEDIAKLRDRARQRAEFGVPDEHLDGHAYHDYTVSAPDGSLRLGLQHNVNGRRVYARGAVAAARFLGGRLEAGDTGTVYSMADVLRG